MKIKNYKCIACGSTEFFAEENKGFPHVGLYCSYCGAFYKWLNKDEKRLFEINKQKGEI